MELKTVFLIKQFIIWIRSPLIWCKYCRLLYYICINGNTITRHPVYSIVQMDNSHLHQYCKIHRHICELIWVIRIQISRMSESNYIPKICQIAHNVYNKRVRHLNHFRCDFLSCSSFILWISEKVIFSI